MSALADWVLAASPAEINAAEWSLAHGALVKARLLLEADGVRHSWIDPYIALALNRTVAMPQPPISDKELFDLAHAFDIWMSYERCNGPSGELGAKAKAHVLALIAKTTGSAA